MKLNNLILQKIKVMFQKQDYNFAESLSSISNKTFNSKESKDKSPDNSFIVADSPSYHSEINGPIDSFELIKRQLKQARQQQDSPRFHGENRVSSANKLNDSADLIKGLYQRNSLKANTNIVPQHQVLIQQQQMEMNIQRCEECNNLFSNKQNRKLCKDCSDKGLDQVYCPYCGDEIVREFAKDHFDDCIACIEDKFKALDNQKECSICMGDITTKMRQLKCQHYFHNDCLEDWLKKKNECPVCRQKL